MALVRFEPSGTEVPGVLPGTRLVDVTDEHPDSAIPYGCRSARCGMCRVHVLEGAQALAPPTEEEA